jgi:hypothetical protein
MADAERESDMAADSQARAISIQLRQPTGL